MKKVFLFLATAALFASCSDDLLEPNNGFQAQDLSSKGITFQVVNDATRGMIDDKDNYKAYFFAERDQIDIYATNAQKWNSSASPKAGFEDFGGTVWANNQTEDDPNFGKLDQKVVYKATSSMADPKFTATTDDYILGLKTYAADHANQGKFFVTYPTAQSVSYVADAKNDAGAVTTPAYFQITAKGLSGQNYAGFMNMDNRYMYAYAEAEKAKEESIKKQNQSFGERVDLKLQSPLSTALFVIRDLEGYDFGKLITITFESEYSPLVPDVVTTNNKTVAATDLITVDEKTYLEGDLDVSFKDGKPEYKDGKLVYKVRKEGDKVLSSTTSSGTAISGDYFTFTPSNAEGKEMAYVSNKRYQKKATLTVSREIAQDEEMNLFVLPAEHSAEKQETYTITYIFDKVTLKYKHTTSGSLAANEKALRFNLWIGPKDDKTPATFPYIVTNESSTGANDRQLIVNTGKFNDIFDSEGNVKWNGETVSPTKFSSIIINSTVEPLDETAKENTTTDKFNDSWDFLNQFTNVTELKILNETTTLVDISKMAKLSTEPTKEHPTNLTANVKIVNADAIPAGIKVLELPNVESFKAPSAIFSALTNLTLTAYDGFKTAGDAKPEVFFNDQTKLTLKTIDLCGVSSLQSVKNRHNGIKFNGFNALTAIYLSDGVKIIAEEFDDCTALTTITGALNITNAASAFSGCDKLTDVRIIGDEIPAETFKESSVMRIHTKDWTGPGKDNADIDKNLVQPTVIGADAFKGNTKIVSLDFIKTTSIGAGAFDGATAFKGNKDATVTLPAAVKTVEANTFNSTKVGIFDLVGVTTTKPLSLNSSAVLQIIYGTSADLTIAFEEKNDKGVIVAEGQVKDRKSSVAVFVQTAANAAIFDGKGYGSVVNENEE